MSKRSKKCVARHANPNHMALAALLAVAVEVSRRSAADADRCTCECDHCDYVTDDLRGVRWQLELAESFVRNATVCGDDFVETIASAIRAAVDDLAPAAAKELRAFIASIPREKKKTVSV